MEGKGIADFGGRLYPETDCRGHVAIVPPEGMTSTIASLNNVKTHFHCRRDCLVYN